MNGREHVLAAIKRAVLPVCAFIVVMELHFGFQVLNYKLNPTAACPPEATADGSCCQSPDETSAFSVYLQGRATGSAFLMRSRWLFQSPHYAGIANNGRRSIEGWPSAVSRFTGCLRRQVVFSPAAAALRCLLSMRVF